MSQSSSSTATAQPKTTAAAVGSIAVSALTSNATTSGATRRRHGWSTISANALDIEATINLVTPTVIVIAVGGSPVLVPAPSATSAVD
jgi:hypothetical protein